MYLIVGLGNYQKKYLKTYHNIGFMAVDKFAHDLSLEFTKEECRALTCSAFLSSGKVLFAKPLTFMNLSGESVFSLMHYYKIPLENLIVVYDDADIPRGALRIRAEGSAGTHNGMKSIISCLGSDKFARLRIGIGKPPEHYDLADFVLSEIKDEDGSLSRAINSAAKALQDFTSCIKLEQIMQTYNS